MGSKHPRTSIGPPPSPSSRAPPSRWDAVKFPSEEAWKRYTQKFSQRSLVPERGLRPDGKTDVDIMAMIAAMKWIHFTKPPEAAVISVVKEFYAMLMLMVPRWHQLQYISDDY